MASPTVAAPSFAANGLAFERSSATLSRHVPWLGCLLAAALIFSRRPDAVTHAQFWAEDGSLFFANVYNHGLLASLLVPQSGYFQELPTLTAGLAQLVPLAFAPLVCNLVAIAVRVLPVALLLHRRAARISPDVRVRAVLAGLYIVLPGVAETHANVDNALWYLAVAAVVVLMLEPPVRRRTRLIDGAILAMCSVTGVFSVVLAPLAILYRRKRRDVPAWAVGILAGGAALQLLAILVLQHHLPAGFGATTHSSLPLEASPSLLLRILGHRVLLAPLIGDDMRLATVPFAMAGVLCLTLAAYACVRGTAEIRLMIGLSAGILALALAQPLGTNWPGLASELNSGRYFLVPQLAAVACLVWACGRAREFAVRAAGFAALALACLVAVPANWSYREFASTGFPQQAAAFEHARPGTRVTFLLNPVAPFTVAPWKMTLVKR